MESETVYAISENLNLKETMTKEEVLNLVTSSDWQDLTLESGCEGSTSLVKPQIRKIGKQVYIRGGFKFTSDNFAVVSNDIPEDCRPSLPVSCICSARDNDNSSLITLAELMIYSNGRFVVSNVYPINNASQVEENYTYDCNFSYMVD